MNPNKLKFKVSKVLALLAVFFIPWGAGLQKVSSFDLSKIFVVMSALLILSWLLFNRKIIFPKWLNIYLLFICFHTFITYVLIFPDDLIFKYVDIMRLREGFVRPVESPGIALFRFFLLILFGYAIASFTDSKRFLTKLCLSYGAGFFCTFALGGYQAAGRLSAGFLDPNAFGLSAVVCIFLSAFVLFMPAPKLYLVMTSVFACTGLLGLFMSGSRGALLGVFIGVLVTILYLPIRKKVFTFTGCIMLCVITILITPSSVLKMAHARTSITLIEKSRGAKRLDIWREYLSNASNYFWCGTGFKRSREAIKNEQHGLYVPHNNYLEVFVEYGIIGLILFLIAMCSLWLTMKKNLVPSRSVILGLFSSWLTISFFLSNFTCRETWLVLAIIIAYGYNIAKKE